MRVLLSGYYGFGNLGDEALLAGLAGALRRSGHQPVVLSHDPVATARAHDVSARHRLRGLLPALLGCDALVSGGGGLLQDRTSRRSLRYYLGAIRLARTLGRRATVFGQSIGPLGPAGERRVALALSGLPVSVRDASSQALLARLGIEAHLGADAALLLPRPTPATDPTAGPVLLVPRHGHPWITAVLAAAARRLGEDGIACAALALHPDQDDGEVAELRRAAPHVLRLEAADHREALAHVATARYVLSGRLHGLILALLCDRGHAGLVYDPKVAGFLADSGAPGFGPTGADSSAPPPAAAAELAALARAAAPPRPAVRTALLARAQAAAAWLDHAIVG